MVVKLALYAIGLSEQRSLQLGTTVSRYAYEVSIVLENIPIWFMNSHFVFTFKRWKFMDELL